MNYRMKFYLTVSALFAIFLSANAKVWMLADQKMALQFNDQTGSLQVTDKRCNKVWQQKL